jgi:hypothetical protein
LSKQHEKKREQAAVIAAAKSVEARNLDLFRRWLRGTTFADLSTYSGLSESQLYKIASADGWKKYENRRFKRRMREAAREIDRTEDQVQGSCDFVEHLGQLGEWREVELVYPKGRAVPPDLFASTNPRVTISGDETRPEVVRVRTFFPGGWSPPSRTWNIGAGNRVSADSDDSEPSPDTP